MGRDTQVRLRRAMHEFFLATGKGALTHWFDFLKWRRQQRRKRL